MQAMIFAAGKGTRLKPLTDVIPKALVPVGDKPLIQHVMDSLCRSGVEHVVINVHHHAGQVRNFLELAQGHYPFTLSVSDETGALLETGGGIKKAIPLFRASEEPVLIHNVDILSNVNLAQFYSESIGNAATLLVSCRQTQRYLLFDDTMHLVGWTNIAPGEVRSPYPDIASMTGKKEAVAERFAGSMFAFSGIHTFSPLLFPLMEQWPDRFPIMDFYLKHCAEVRIKGLVKRDLRLLDVGKQDTLATAEEFIQNINNDYAEDFQPYFSRAHSRCHGPHHRQLLGGHRPAFDAQRDERRAEYGVAHDVPGGIARALDDEHHRTRDGQPQTQYMQQCADDVFSFIKGHCNSLRI